MVRLIYAAMALALGALVTGFFVNTSSAPLLASIVLSAAVMLLILFGWSRRIRQGMDLYSGEESGSEAVTDIGDAEIEVVELEPDEFRAPKAKAKPAALRRRAAEREAAEAAAAAGADSTAVLPTSTGRAARTAKARPGAKPKPRPAAAGKARPAPKPKPPAPARTRSKKTPARSAKSPARTAAKPKKTAPAARASRSKASPGQSSTAQPKGKRKTKPETKPKTNKVLVIPGRSKYHRRGCRFAKGDDVREVSESTARNRGYEPCNVCSP